MERFRAACWEQVEELGSAELLRFLGIEVVVINMRNAYDSSKRTSASTSCQVLLSKTPVEMSPSITILTSKSAVTCTGTHGSKERCNVEEREVKKKKNQKW